jgi:CRISPR-associated protein Csy2
VVIRFSDDAACRLDDIGRFLRGGRLAGGAIIEYGKPAHAADDNELAKAVRKIGSGFSIMSRQDLMAPAEGDRDTLDTLLRLTSVTDERTEDQKWLMPTALGYLEITPRKQRRNVRGGFVHAYAEPLVGLVQYRSLRDVGLHFWRYQHPQPAVIVAATDAA